MARPRSDDRRNAIMAAAIQAIAAHGLGASTASIGKEAGVSNGSLFTYFETKADLFNQLYIELKTEMAAAAMDGLPTDSDVREQLLHMWLRSLRWATACPEKRRTLAHLCVSDDLTPETHQVANRTMASIVQILERSRQNGPMRDAPLELVACLMNGLADATTDFIINNPDKADQHGKVAFEALWRIVA